MNFVPFGSRTLARALALPLLALPLLSLGACVITPVDKTTTPSVEGELGNGTFFFTCNPSATVCPTAKRGKDASIALATGGRLRVKFQRKTDAQSNTAPSSASSLSSTESVKAASPETMGRAEDGSFVALKPGFTTLLATNTTDEVIDFAVVTIARPARLDFTANGTSVGRNARKFTVRKGATVNLSAVLYDEFDVQLAGDVNYQFGAEDQALAKVDLADDRTAEIKGLETGSTKLIVEGAGMRRELELEVTP
jgi:hypothetical protein